MEKTTTSKLERVVALLLRPLRDSYRYADKGVSNALHPRSFAEALATPVYLQMATAPLIFVTLLYGATLFGIGKGVEYVYDSVQSRIRYENALSIFSEVNKDMNLPPEYGRMERSK